jgi:hypothetical protein
MFPVPIFSVLDFLKSYNEMPVLGNIIKKRGLFWLMVLVQGQEPASSDGLLAGRVLRRYM